MTGIFRRTLPTIAMLALCSTLAKADGADSGFREIRVAPGLATGDQFIDVVAPFLRDHPESLEGNPALDMAVRRVEAGFKVDIVKSGFLDDSVSGQHWRGFVIQNSDGQWELLTMAVKDVCRRGRNAEGLCR